VLLCLALIPLLVAPAEPASPIQVQALVRETPEGPVRGWIARVDLTDLRVSFVVTSPMEHREGDPARAEARLVPTDAWAETASVDLAVNAGFFDRVEGTGAPAFGWTDGLPVDLVGLSRSEGRTVSPPRHGGGDAAPADPALLIDETNGGRCPCLVRAAHAGDGDLDGIEDAVAGYGARNGNPGSLLVENGENRGATAQVAPTQRHPRTAAGVSRDGRTLLLVVVDGRQPGWSIGATLPELARLVLDAGAWNAVNLDGGGSSAMWHRQPGAPAGRTLNRPSDGRVRPVANHFGVRVVPAPPARSSR
jgi:hypothetical protein